MHSFSKLLPLLSFHPILSVSLLFSLYLRCTVSGPILDVPDDDYTSQPLNPTLGVNSHRQSITSRATSNDPAVPSPSYGPLSTGVVVLIGIGSSIVLCVLIGWFVTGGPKAIARKVKDWVQRQLKGDLAKLQSDRLEDGEDLEGDDGNEESGMVPLSQSRSHDGTVVGPPGSVVEMKKIWQNTKKRPNVSSGHNTSAGKAPPRPTRIQSALQPYRSLPPPPPPSTDPPRSSSENRDAWWKTSLYHPSDSRRQNRAADGGPSSVPTSSSRPALSPRTVSAPSRLRSATGPDLPSAVKFAYRTPPTRVNCRHGNADASSTHAQRGGRRYRSLSLIDDLEDIEGTSTAGDHSLENLGHGINEKDFAADPKSSAATIARTHRAQTQAQAQAQSQSRYQAPFSLQGPHADSSTSRIRAGAKERKNAHLARLEELHNLSDSERHEWRKMWWPERAVWSKDLRGRPWDGLGLRVKDVKGVDVAGDANADGDVEA